MYIVHSCFEISEEIKTLVTVSPHNQSTQLSLPPSGKLHCLTIPVSLHSLWKWSTEAQKHSYTTQDKSEFGENKRKASDGKHGEQR